MKRTLLVILSIAVLVSAIEVVVSQHEARRLFVQIQELEAERDDLNEEWGRLQLEQSTWATDDRIESLARSELRMREPGGNLKILAQP